MDDDPEMKEFRDRLEEFRSLSREERLELVTSLLKRDDRRERGIEVFRKAYPGAGDEMLGSASHHAYTELPEALTDLLAWNELCLRKGSYEQHSGLLFEALYHLYNWLQIEALVPWGSRDVLDELADLKQLIADDDKEGAEGTLEALMERFDGSASPPDSL